MSPFSYAFAQYDGQPVYSQEEVSSLGAVEDSQQSEQDSSDNVSEWQEWSDESSLEQSHLDDGNWATEEDAEESEVVVA